ncbi:MAG: tetratricopeptide repeat protein [Bdellovibrionota bacterium]
MSKKSLVLVVVFVSVALVISVGFALRMRVVSHQIPSLPPPPKGVVYELPVVDDSLPIDAYEKRAEQEPGALAFNALAQAYYRLGKRNGKQENFEKAKILVARSLAEQSSENKAARALSIRLLQAEHEFERSLEKIAEFEKDFPSAEVASTLKITALVALGRSGEALAIANAIVAALPTSGAFVLAGSVAEEAGDARRAVALLSTAIEDEEPGEAAALTFPRAVLGRLYLRRGQLEDARVCLESALKIDAEDVMSLRLLAHLEALEGNYRAAEQALVKAIGVYSDADIFVQLSRVKRLLGDPRQAADMLRTAESTFREDLAKSHYGHRLQMAQMLLERKTQESAKEAATVARDDLASRGHPFVKIVLARALVESGAASMAREVLDPVLASSFENPSLFLVAGKIARAEKNDSEANRFFERATAMNSNYRENCEYCPLF